MSWSVFSKNRKYLMGFAIALIMMFHWCENFGLLQENVNGKTIIGYIAMYAVNGMTWIGACGVEVFLFLSGIGLYFSFTKNSDLKVFYIKRLIAIIIPYLIIAVPYQLWQNFIYTDRGILHFLADLSLVTTFTKFNRQGWYVALILIMYAVFPFYYWFMKKHSNIKFIILEAVFCVLPLAVQYWNKSLFDATQVALTRIPTFILGVYCGRFVYENKKMRMYPFLLAAALIAVLAVKHLMIHMNIHTVVAVRYEKALIMLIVLIGIAWVIDKFSLKRTKALFAFLAPMTLELYLTHVEVRRMFSRLFVDCWSVSNINLAFVSIIAISVPIAWYVNKQSGDISEKIKSHIRCLNN